MALTAAEKQRRYRERRDADPDRRALHRAKQREKYLTDKKVGKRKSIKEMTVREQRYQRRQWNNYKRKERERRFAQTLALTPPSSPLSVNDDLQHQPSRQLSSSRKKIKREKAKCYKENEKLRVKLKIVQQRAEKYKKRWIREKGQKEKGNKGKDTPRKKTKRVLKCGSTKTVRRTLFFHHVLIEEMRKKYNTKSGRKTVSAVAAGLLIKKYKMQSLARKSFGKAFRVKKKKRCAPRKETETKVREFLERDDVSRMTSGKRNTITRKKEVKQKRLLKDTMKNLFMKFKSENKVKLSYTTFCRLRPFWIVIPKEGDRDTCACKLCENVQYLCEALEEASAITHNKAEDLVPYTVCSKFNKECMYKECSLCAQKRVPVVITDGNKEVNWKQWKSVKEKRTMKDKEEKEIVLTVKKDEHGTLNELVDLFEEQFPRYQRHMFNVINQYKHYKVLKENLGSTECFCHVDFAENYVGKMTSEIQSMHFGASKPQITMHTGFFTVGGKKDIVTFCGVSDSLQHDPSSIWAFLKPILRSIKQKHPHIDTIHFFSDGPTSQYRQKANFFLLSTEIFNEGFSKATWNFHEAGHGKGIPDGIGGTLKRSADLTIRQGKVDIMNAQQFIDAFTPSSTSIYLYKVDQSDIDTVGESLKNVNLKTVPGTMKLHQVITNVSGTIRFREVSCTCEQNVCDGHDLKDFTLHEDALSNSNKKRKSNEKVQNEKADVDTNHPEKKRKTKAKAKAKNVIKQAKGKRMKKAKVETNNESESNTDDIEENTLPDINTFEDLLNEGQADSNISRKQNEAKKIENEEDIGKVCSAGDATLSEDKGVKNEKNFASLLHKFESCSTFEELEKECLSCDVADVVGHPRFIIDDALDVDDDAIEMFPEDVPDNQSRFPISVRADGDCLPASGSVYAYGHDKCPNELRARIVIELTLNKAYYLEEKNLRKGLSEFEPKTRNHVKKSFAMYSDGYIPGITLSDEIIETIYEREVMDVSKPKSFMGIWQLCALSSVLKMPLFSAYPKLGNPVVRKDLHRLLLPREIETCSETAYVLWTTTRNDMSFFVPNHFVPVLPIASLEDEYKTGATVNKTIELNVKNDSDDQVLYEGESAECRLRAQESKRRNTDNLDDISKCKRVDETGQRRENWTKDKVDPKVESSENEMHYKNDENTESVMRVNGETEKEKKNNESEKNEESVVKLGETVYKKEKDGRFETKMRKEDSIESSNGERESKSHDNTDSVECRTEKLNRYDQKTDSNVERDEQTQFEKADIREKEIDNVEGRSRERKESSNEEEEKMDEVVEEVERKENRERVEKVMTCLDVESEERLGVDNEGNEESLGSMKSEKEFMAGTEKEHNSCKIDGGKESYDKKEEGGDGERREELNGSIDMKGYVRHNEHQSNMYQSREIMSEKTNGRDGSICPEKKDRKKRKSERIKECMEKMKLLAEQGPIEIGIESDELIKSKFNEIVDPKDCLQKYVVVLYDGVPYPGYVEDIDNGDVYVKCMHLIGKQSHKNCFFWPKKIQDKCWYLCENIVTMIPEPVNIPGTSQYQVEPTLWQRILDHVGLSSV